MPSVDTADFINGMQLNYDEFGHSWWMKKNKYKALPVFDQVFFRSLDFLLEAIRGIV